MINLDMIYYLQYIKILNVVFKFSPVEAEYSKYFSNIFWYLISFANQFNDSLKINKNVNYKNILKSFLMIKESK